MKKLMPLTAVFLSLLIALPLAISVTCDIKTPAPEQPEGSRTCENLITENTPETAEPETEQAAETEPERTEPVTTTEKTEPTVIERVYVIPVHGYVLKDYTMDLPVYSVTMNDYRVHNGVDISASVGDPVYAFSDGVVSKIYNDPMMGQTVVIDHGDGLLSVYQNLQVTLPENIETGVRVEAGDVIGAVGETALIECAEVPHLHFCITKNSDLIEHSQVHKADGIPPHSSGTAEICVHAVR